jgi:DNA modification methylase
MSRIETIAEGITLHPGDCLDVLAAMADASVDSCVCDPPYHLTSIVKRFGAPDAASAKSGKTGAYARASRGFMGKQWDGGDIAFRTEVWAHVLRVLKPGGHLLAFSGTRTYHRMTCAIEDAGFEIRDQIGWAYGSGFPKSHDVSKGIDRAAGAEREIVGIAGRTGGGRTCMNDAPGNGRARDYLAGDYMATTAATDEAAQWQGWGTALKPAWEPVVMARKPLIGTVAQNVLQHGTGAINIDGCRVSGEVPQTTQGASSRIYGGGKGLCPDGLQLSQPHTNGRWPANIVHDGSDEVVGAFPDAPGQQRYVGPEHGEKIPLHTYGKFGARDPFEPRGDSGSAARFFYTAKADADDRLGSKHPTVKPLDLMQWLVRLVTPPPRLVCPQCDRLAYEKDCTTTGRTPAPLRAMQQNVQAEGQQTQQPILQQTVRECGDDAEAKGVRVLSGNIPAQGVGTEVLREALRPQMDSGKPINDEGICNLKKGLSPALEADAPAGEGAEGIHFRASLEDGAAHRSVADEGRGGPPQERRENRQSDREPRIDVEGRSRQAKSSAPKHPDVPPLRGANNRQPTCKNCGSHLEKIGGIVLDCFAGTGTTGEAAFREGFRAVLIEREPEYQNDIRRRMSLVLGGPDERRRESIKASGKAEGAGPLFEGIA